MILKMFDSTLDSPLSNAITDFYVAFCTKIKHRIEVYLCIMPLAYSVPICYNIYVKM